jgi:hypothetical protein
MKRLLAIGILVLAAPSAAQAAGDFQRPQDPVDHTVAEPIANHAQRMQPTAVLKRRSLMHSLGAPIALPSKWCGDETTRDNSANAFQPERPAIKLIYAYPNDRESRFGEQADAMQASVSQIGLYVAGATNNQKTLRFDMGTRCGPEYVDIEVVKLPRKLDEYMTGGGLFGDANFDLVAADAVRSVHYSRGSGFRTLAIWADYTAGDTVPGWGTARLGGPVSPVSYAPAYRQSRDFEGGAATAAAAFVGNADVIATQADPRLLLHEIVHTMGAVPEDSPHATSNGHCWQDYDLMCYDDGGIPIGKEMTIDCPAEGGSSVFLAQAFDCGNDDYFRSQPGTAKGQGVNVYDNLLLQPCAELPIACGGNSAALPDRDSDAMPNAYDLCPTVKGPNTAQAHGCPYRNRGVVTVPVTGNRTVNGTVKGVLDGTLASFRISSRRLPAGTWKLIACVREEDGEQSTEGPSGTGCYAKTFKLRKPGPASYTGRVRIASNATGVRFTAAFRDSRNRVLSRTPVNLGVGEIDALY